MANILVVLALTLCAAISTISEDIDCSGKFTCDQKNPGFFYSRGMKLGCNPGSQSLVNICNFHPVDDQCAPCVEKTKLCDKFFTCTSDTSKVIISGIEGNCPPNYRCNNEGDEFECSPCKKKECPTQNKWKCLNETTAIQNGEFVLCDDNAICNEENVEPCDRPCVSKDPYADPYIILLRTLSISLAQTRG